MMLPALICLPEGLLRLSGTPHLPVPPALAKAFERGAAEAVVHLAGLPVHEAPPDPSLAWLHRFSQLWMAAVCRTRLASPPPPDEEMPGSGQFAPWLQAAPPFPGSEYLSPALAASLWDEAGTVLESQCAEFTDGLEGFLRAHPAGWHLVGRVTFHLAENKRDPDKPFAFLATYTDALGAAGKPQHLPLGRALQIYGAAQDRRTLESILDPVRTAAGVLPWVHSLLETRRVFQALAWEPSEAWLLIRDIPALEAAGLVLKVPDWWKGGRPARPAVQVKLDTGTSSLGADSMLQFHVSTTLDAQPLSAEDWDRIRNSTTGLVNLRGQWVEVDQAKLGQVMDHWEKVAAAHASGGLTFHEGMRFLAGFHPGSAAGEEDETDRLLPGWSEVVAGKNLADALHRLRHPAPGSQTPQVNAVLRPYQEKGVAWLDFMRRLGLGACLADDMGLGKTLQVIALLTLRNPTTPQATINSPGRRRPSKSRNPADVLPDSSLNVEAPANAPVLVVVPASLLGNWEAEFAAFAPQLRIFTAHPSRMRKDQSAPALDDPAHSLRGWNVVLTTYGVLQRTPGLQSAAWQAVILDEAQAIKNAGTAQAKAIKNIQTPWRLALTGTPVENRPGDLWSLFDFLNPGLLGGAKAFAATLKRLAGHPSGFAPLRRLIQPYLLRRMKTDKSIIADLPDKTEVTAACALSRKQAIIYGRLVEQLKKDLKDPDLDPRARRGLVVAYLMKFKQVCNHSSHWSGDGVYAPADSGKFQRLAELCAEIHDRQERVLIFTQFREIIDPLHAFLTGVFRRPGLILHGGTAVKDRQQRVQQFQAPGGPPFFILSVKAGGTGLTLTAASHVIHFDRWWNPAVENQATDRAFRIGQKRNVLVHKFVTTGTLEERIDAMIQSKKTTADQLLSSDGAAETALTGLSDEALLEWVALDAATAFASL